MFSSDKEKLQQPQETCESSVVGPAGHGALWRQWIRHYFKLLICSKLCLITFISLQILGFIEFSLNSGADL